MATPRVLKRGLLAFAFAGTVTGISPVAEAQSDSIYTNPGSPSHITNPASPYYNLYHENGNQSCNKQCRRMKRAAEEKIEARQKAENAAKFDDMLLDNAQSAETLKHAKEFHDSDVYETELPYLNQCRSLTAGVSDRQEHLKDMKSCMRASEKSAKWGTAAAVAGLIGVPLAASRLANELAKRSSRPKPGKKKRHGWWR